MRIIAERTAIIAIALLVVVYVSDFLFIEYKVHANAAAAFGAVQVERYYSIEHKDGRAEIVHDPPETDVCVHSLFPHFGHDPCWYTNWYAHRSIRFPTPLVLF